MAEILLFHHAYGLTAGVLSFAETLREAGHTVHTPDLYEGNVFETLDEGLAYARAASFDAISERGLRSADELPAELVYGGFSLGELPAQELAQTRPGAAGALLFCSCVPTSEFGGAWPSSVPVQVHGMDQDPFFFGDGDIEAARALVAEARDGELFTYPGDKHLFADSSLPDYDQKAATLMTERVLEFLAQKPIGNPA